MKLKFMNYKTVCWLSCCFLICNSLNCYAVTDDDKFSFPLISNERFPASRVHYPKSIELCLPQPVAQCNAQCIQNVQNTLDRIRQNNNIPGMQMTISYANQPMQTFCSGTTTKDGSVLIGKNSLFEVGSITKGFTAAVMLQLEAEGKVNLNSFVKDWFTENEYAQWNNITISQLLDMTAGTFDFVETTDWMSQPLNRWTAKELNNLSYNKGPMCELDKDHPNCPDVPGNGWDYSNNNYIITERIIEKASNATLQENLYQRILKPLGLVNTIYNTIDSPIKFDNMTHGYRVFIPKGSRNSMADLTVDLTSVPLDGIRGAGALISTSEDLAKWARALFSGKILEVKQLKEMTSLVCTGFTSGCKPGESISYTSNESGDGYGIFHQQAVFGQPWWFDNKDSTWWHNGAYGGFQSIFLYDADKNFVITATKNTNDTFWWGELLNEVSKILFT